MPRALLWWSQDVTVAWEPLQHEGLRFPRVLKALPPSLPGWAICHLPLSSLGSAPRCVSLTALLSILPLTHF